MVKLRISAHAVIVCAKSSYFSARLERNDNFADAPAYVCTPAPHAAAAVTAAAVAAAPAPAAAADEGDACEMPASAQCAQDAASQMDLETGIGNQCPAESAPQAPLGAAVLQPGQRVLTERGLTAEQLPLARALIRFMYTGNFEESVQGDVGALLGVS